MFLQLFLLFILTWAVSQYFGIWFNGDKKSCKNQKSEKKGYSLIIVTNKKHYEELEKNLKYLPKNYHIFIIRFNDNEPKEAYMNQTVKMVEMKLKEKTYINLKHTVILNLQIPTLLALEKKIKKLDVQPSNTVYYITSSEAIKYWVEGQNLTL
jgi:hypothetical protein